MHLDIPRPRDTTELNNDGMIDLDDVHCRIYQFFQKIFNKRRFQFLFAYSFSN